MGARTFVHNYRVALALDAFIIWARQVGRYAGWGRGGGGGHGGVEQVRKVDEGSLEQKGCVTPSLATRCVTSRVWCQASSHPIAHGR